MHIKEFLENVCNEIRYKPMRKDIAEELELHIEEGKQHYIDNGFSVEEAEEKSVSNMGNAEEIGKKLNKIHRPKLDWMIFILVAILIGFGILMSYITLRRTENIGRFYRHIFFLIIGLFLGFFIYHFDYRKIKRYSIHIYIVSSIIIIFCKIFGYSINGVNLFVRGIEMPYFCLYLYLLAFAGFISDLRKEKKINFEFGKLKLRINFNLLKIIALSVISIILIDSVSGLPRTFLLLITYCIISLFSVIVNSKDNLKKNLLKYGIVTTIIVISLITYFWNTDDMFDFFVKREMIDFIRVFSPDREILNGWHGLMINNVLKNANIFSGLNDMKNYQGLFDGGTDCALITIIAYCGIVYSIIIILSLILLCIKLMIDCKSIKDVYGKTILVSLSTIMLLQALINILMNFDLIPIMNVGLPFVSYGNTGLLTNMFSIALILAIYRRKDILYKEKKQGDKLKLKIYFE